MSNPELSMQIAELFRLDGVTALVTGASSGLGMRSASVLHAAGATVVVSARRADRLDELVNELGDRAVSCPGDLSLAADRERLVETAVNVSGHIGVLVNNAGLSQPVAALDETLEQFGRSLEINLVAPFHLSQLAAAHMLQAGAGSIINMASILGLVAASPMKDVSYGSSKGALANMTRQLGCE